MGARRRAGLRSVKRLLLAVFALAAAGAGWVVWRLNDHPSMAPYSAYRLPAGEPPPAPTADDRVSGP